jgi:6-pyruvoyltetrahydropterin/6-carboxytetrahydropterin synthase
MYNHDWTEERNVEVFGKCANKNWHGHNYDLYITVKGDPNPDTGYVVDLKDLSALVRANVVNKVDHKNINLDVDFMRGKLASTENMAIAFWEQLEADIAALGCQLHSIKLYETENNMAEYFGGK